MELKAGIGARDMARCALMAVVIAVCSWINVPIGPVPFTMQTFGVCMALSLLGGMRGTLAIAVYVLMGALGAPVFAGFNSGAGALLNATGGYILGFIATGLIYWLINARAGARTAAKALGLALGLVGCYAFGTAWFMAAYARSTGPIGLGAALGLCVAPFIAPDALKLGLALALAQRVRARLRS